MSNNRNKTNSNNKDDEGQQPKANKERNSKEEGLKEEDAFQSLLKEAFQTIIQSDVQRPDGSSSQGRWVYDPAARRLQAVMDRLVIHVSFFYVAACCLMMMICCTAIRRPR